MIASLRVQFHLTRWTICWALKMQSCVILRLLLLYNSAEFLHNFLMTHRLFTVLVKAILKFSF